MIDTVSKDNADVMNLLDDDEADMICDGRNRKGSILVVDGDNHIRNKLSAITDRIGCDVVVARNGEEALEKDYLLGARGTQKKPVRALQRFQRRSKERNWIILKNGGRG